MKKQTKLIVGIIIIALLVMGVFLIATLNSSNDNTETINIKTSYATIDYEHNWGDDIDVKEKDNIISFYGKVDGKDEQHLYDIIFGGDDGILLGTYKSGDKYIPVNLIIAEFSPDGSWTEEEKDIIYSMQEDMNVIVDELKKDKNFEE